MLANMDNAEKSYRDLPSVRITEWSRLRSQEVVSRRRFGLEEGGAGRLCNMRSSIRGLRRCKSEVRESEEPD